MTYIDSSVALAELLSETKRPSTPFWSEPMVSSRLLEYEVTVRLHAIGPRAKVLRAASNLLASVTYTELGAPALARALQPFPVSVRTLDAIHLSTMVFVRERGITVQFATYDTRLGQAAVAMGFVLLPM